MLDSWSISRRVNSGFVLQTVMVAGLSFFSYSSIKSLGEGYVEFRQSAQQTVAINAYYEDYLEAQLALGEYVLTASATARSDFLSNIDEVIDNESQLAAFAPSPDRQADIQNIIAQTRAYRTAFEQVSGARAEAKRIQQDIFARSDIIRVTASELFVAAVLNGNPRGIIAASEAGQSFLSSKIDLNEYFLAQNLEALERSLETFARIENNFSVLGSLGLGAEVETALAKAEEAMRGFEDRVLDYKQALDRSTEITATLLEVQGTQIQSGIENVVDEIVARQNVVGPEGARIVEQLTLIIPLAGTVATIVAILAALTIGRWISRSVQKIAQNMTRLASGDNSIRIEGSMHTHELRQMASALETFKENQQEIEVARAEQLSQAQKQQAVVSSVKSELEHLAAGDLTASIDQAFDPEYEDLRKNFNAAVEALQSAIVEVSDTSHVIQSAAQEATTSATELSQRTESQAATLEQTAAALEELTNSVRTAAEHARSVDDSVHKARSEAERNGEIVAEAVQAMDSVAESSQQITQVINVIDDIAFQTNLLALNAGVEAARAGESGKGFAVFASEVRALAQKSADAAKEISELISNSSQHVERGTHLVGNAGDALGAIITQVNEIADMTSQIASSSEEQAVGLSEINSGVNQLDQVTQQNAAMVQESLSRGDALSSETRKLSQLIDSFKVGATSKRTAIPNGTQKSSAMPPVQDRLANAIENTVTAGPPPTQPRQEAPPPAKRAATGTYDEPMWEDF